MHKKSELEEYLVGDFDLMFNNLVNSISKLSKTSSLQEEPAYEKISDLLFDISDEYYLK